MSSGGPVGGKHGGKEKSLFEFFLLCENVDM
jgi:hypothetical protein